MKNIFNCVWIVLVTAGFTGNCQDLGTIDLTNLSTLTAQQRHEYLFRTTPAYRKEALRLVLEEANKAAKELKLPEALPITEGNLIAHFINHPRLKEYVQRIGNVTTSNYLYYVSTGDKFSGVVRTHYDEELSKAMEKYHWPLWKVNTNAAYQLATQWLAAVSMDVDGLNRDCRRSIDVCLPDEENRYFVPNYRISWSKAGEPVALVEVFLPTRTLRDLTIEESKYILRSPIVIHYWPDISS